MSMKSEDISFLSHFAVLLLAGSGERLKEKELKQYRSFGQKPLFLYAATILDASPEVDAILFVVKKGYEEETKAFIKKANLSKPFFVLVGGSSRAESSKIATTYLQEKGAKPSSLVLFQDADRPNLSETLVRENYQNAEKKGASITAQSITDSVIVCKESGLVDGYLPREEVFLVQTPEAFRLSLLLDAYQKVEESKKTLTYTDEGSLVLFYENVAPLVVNGSKENYKITDPFEATTFSRSKEK